MGIKAKIRSTAFSGGNLLLEHVPSFMKGPLLAGLGRLPFEKRLPSFIMIEPTNACNIRCPLCPVGADVMERKRGFIDVDNYKRLIDEVAGFVRDLNMNFAGEPLLHKQIGTLIEYAERRGIAVTVGTNGTIDKMDELLDAGTSEVLYAMDGLSDQTYNEYRRGGTLDQVKANLAKLTEGKRSRGASKPNIVLQFVVMKHNEHEIDELMKLAHEYGVDEVALTPVCINDFFGVEKRRLIDKYMPEDPRYRQYKFRNGRIVERKPAICNWVFQSVVLYNGDVSICCFDFDGKHIVGNAFEDGGYLAVWRSERYRKLRDAILQRKLKLCNECDLSTIKPLHFSSDGDSLGRRR